MPQQNDLSDLPELSSQKNTRSRLPSLTGLRFIAAFMVFAFHSVMYGDLFSSAGTTKTLGVVASGGGMTGVSFFFVLSGFVLAWSARSSDTVTRFYRRRLVKIFPNHLVTAIAAFLLLIWLSGAVVNYTWAFNLLLVHAWFPNLTELYSGNVVSWSLSCELLFYLSFPLLHHVIKRIRPERLWAWAGVVVVAIFLVPTLADALPQVHAIAGSQVQPVVDLTLWQQWFIATFPPVRMLEFVFGIIVARIVITGRKVPLSFGGAVALMVAAYFLTALFPGPYRVAATMVVPLGLVIAAGAKADADNKGGWISSRLMVWLGNVSFAFYMVHWLVIDYVRRWLGATTSWSTVGGLAVLALLFGCALLAATLLYTCVERPIMRRFASPRRRLTAVPTPLDSAGPPDRNRIAG
jgi:peptidoglycan/LPS O-acetylase OafA/YrhL